MREEVVQLVEEYNPQGVCIKRTVNGYELPPDTEPSVQIFKHCENLTRKFYMTQKEFNEMYAPLLTREDK